MDGERTDVTLPERWAARRASGTTWLSLFAVAVGPCLLIYFAVQSPASKFYTVIALVMCLVFVVLGWWEAVGFKRLLARRDAEIGRLSSGDGSV